MIVLIVIIINKSGQDMESYLTEQNLHWQNQTYDAGYERELLSTLMDLVDSDQIIAISGIHRCGKSFLLKQIINRLLSRDVAPENILYVNLELPVFRDQSAHKILETILETWQQRHSPAGRVYLFLDAIQTLSEWETWLMYQYDSNIGKVKFFITGSSRHLLTAETNSLLAGRVIERQLFPFSFREYLDFRGLEWREPQERSLNRDQIRSEFECYITFGGMPETLAIEQIELKRKQFIGYFNTILYRDITSWFAIRDGAALNELAVHVLGHISDTVTISQLARHLGGDRSSLGDFLRYLTLHNLLIRIEKFSPSAKTRQRSRLRYYAMDTGFISWLVLPMFDDREKLLKNLVLIELLRQGSTVYYWRRSSECDFLVETVDDSQHSLKRQAIQVYDEKGDSSQSRELGALVRAGKAFNAEEHTLLTFDTTDRVTQKDTLVNLLPVYDWMLDR